MMLFFSICRAVAAFGLSTFTPGSSMKLVVEMKKMRRNMITSMSGINSARSDSSGSSNVRRNLMPAAVGRLISEAVGMR